MPDVLVSCLQTYHTRLERLVPCGYLWEKVEVSSMCEFHTASAVKADAFSKGHVGSLLRHWAQGQRTTFFNTAKQRAL